MGAGGLACVRTLNSPDPTNRTLGCYLNRLMLGQRLGRYFAWEPAKSWSSLWINSKEGRSKWTPRVVGFSRPRRKM